MKIRLKQFFVLLVLMISFCAAFSANYPNLSGVSSTETFTLNQLSKMDTATLTGSRPSYTFYIPVPNQWQVSAIDLNLIIQFSPLLLKSSSLTVMVGDTPLDSIKLDNTKSQPLLWKIRIPEAYISKRMTTIRLVGYMVISEEICQDIENQGNWVTLSGNSSITYHYQNKQSGWSLMDFPYPFIHKDAPFIDKVSFYLPDKIGMDDFAPYFKFANLLSKEASWRGIEIDVNYLNKFPDSGPIFPSVIIGTPDTVDFSLLGNPEALQLKNDTWLKDNGIPLADSEGFVWLRRIGQQPVLIISANSKKGLATAVESINSKRMHFMVTSTSFFIAQPESFSEKKVREKSNVSLRDLGYEDNVVFGSGQSQLNYQFNLPAQYTNRSVKLVLNYSHSPFLQQDRASTISILINGFPVDGAVLQANSSQIHTLELELPQKQLQPGKNTLTITFNLQLAASFCSRDYLSQAWGTVYNNSSLQFYESEHPIRQQIKSYPALMEGNVLVGLPDNFEVYQNKQLIKSMISFAMTLDNSLSLHVMSTQSLRDKTGQGNLVYFATGTLDSPIIDTLKATFRHLIDNLNATSNSTLRNIDKSIFINAFQKRQDIGFIGISSIGPQENFTQLILYGFTPDELNLALNLLNNKYKLGFLSGNLAVSFQNGTFTSLSSNEIQEHVQREIAMNRVSQLTINYILYGLGGLMFGFLVYFGWRKWRTKS
ncbi:cellulose biosynthesis cyclic di-GMP-binding regulatory protein BcsB [Legionella pneumophila serogroup 10]